MISLGLQFFGTSCPSSTRASFKIESTSFSTDIEKLHSDCYV